MSARWLIVSGVIGVILAVCVPALLFLVISPSRPRLAAVTADAAPVSAASRIKLKLRWQLPARGLKDVSFSPDGRFIGFVDSDGVARCYTEEGMLKWSRKFPSPAPADLQVGAGGAFSMAYSLLNPELKVVYFIGEDGRIRWIHHIDGAPWSAAAAADRKGFAVGTGEKYVYVYSIGQKTKRYVRWKSEGAPTSVAFTPFSGRLVIGSWQDSGVGLYTANGDNDWLQSGEQDKLYFVQVDMAGESVLSVAQPNRRLPVAVLTLLDRTGGILWDKEIQGKEIRALLSPTGRAVAVGLITQIEHKGKQVSERHVLFYNDAGRVVWDKGGMFFKPRLLAVPSEDAVIVYDSKFIYVLDHDGKATAREKAPGAIIRSWTSADSTRFAVLCNNDKIYYYTLR